MPSPLRFLTCWLPGLPSNRTPRKRRNRRRLIMESLECRALLAADLSAIAGTVFIDQTDDGLTPDDIRLEGVTITLFRDGGDGVFASDDDLVDSTSTDDSGRYRFDDLEAGLYFVEQTPTAGMLQRPDERVGSVVITAADAQGTQGTSIDTFDLTDQKVEVSSLVPISHSESKSAAEAIGGQRDMLVELISGPGDVVMRVLHLDRPILVFSGDSGAVGRGVVTWDGPDNDADQLNPVGLNGYDLTEQGTNVGIQFLQGADLPGGTLTLFVYSDADNYSSYSQPIPQTPLGTAEVLTIFRFSDFQSQSGNGADFANVGAIQLEIQGVPAMDAQIDELGTIGPTVKTQNFANLNPMSLGDTVWFDADNNGRRDAGEPGIAGVELSLYEDTDGNGSFTPGIDQALATTVTDNNGNYGFSGLFPGDYLVQIVPANFEPDGALVGLFASTGLAPVPDPNDDVDDDNNGYELANFGAISRAMTLAAGSEPVGGADQDPNTNLTLDFGFTAIADLQVVKSDDPDPVTAGNTLTYTLVVTNHGPSLAKNTVLTDPLPAGVSLISVDPSRGTAEVVSGVVTVDLGDLTVGESATVTIVVTVDSSLTQGLLNTAQVISDAFDPVPQNNLAEEPTEVQRLVNLNIVKSGTPDPVVAGRSLTYTLVVRNDGPSDATGVTVVDTLPGGVIYGTSTSSQGTVSHSNGTVTVNLGDLASGQSATVTLNVDVSPETRGVLLNQAIVSAIEDEIDPDDNTATAETTVLGEVDLSITKTDSPDPVLVGENLTYTLSVNNLGPSGASGVTVIDTLPTDVQFVSATPTLGTATHSNGTVTVNLGEMAPGQAETVTIVVAVAPAASGTLVNTATVSGNEQETNSNNNTATVSTVVQPLVDLAITKSGVPTPAVAGEHLTYTVSVSNMGPSGATGVTVVDTLPAGVLFVSALPTQGTATHDNGTVTVDLGDLANGQTETIMVVVAVASSARDTLVNTATVSGNEQETDTTNNTASVSTVVQPLVDLVVFKADSPDPVIAGENLTYILSIINNGPSDATGVTVTDQLPVGVQFVEATTSQGSFVHADGTVTIDLGNLASGASATVNIVVHVDPSTRGTITNTASVTGTELDSQLQNNTDSEPTLVQAQIDLAVTKTSSPDRGTAGGQLTYTLTVTNQGPSDATEVIVQDLLPLPVEFVSADAGQAAVDQSQQLVTVNLGNLDAGASRTITLVTRVDSDFAGTITNRAAVSGAEPETILDNNTALRTTVIDALMSSLAGFVYVDRDNNGLKDAGEEGIEGVRVWLNGTARDGSTIARQQLTASDGSYRFDDLPAGIYQLTQDQPQDYLDGRDTPGTAPTDLVENNRFDGIHLLPGVDAVNFRFGERLPILSKRLFLGSTQ